MVKHKMIISKATPEEYYFVRHFYHSLIDALEGTKYHPMWQKDIYPAPEELCADLCFCIRDSQLFRDGYLHPSSPW